MIERDPRWMHGSYGRKIETALECKEDSKNIKLITGQEFKKQVEEYMSRKDRT